VRTLERGTDCDRPELGRGIRREPATEPLLGLYDRMLGVQ